MDALNNTIAIIGAGPVGLAFALFHASESAPVTLIDRTNTDVAQKDPRSLALSYGSIQLLETIGVDFKQLPHAPIQHIHISEHGAWGHTQLHHDEQNVPMLGAVVRYGDLVTQLTSLAQRKQHVQFIRPAQILTLTDNNQYTTLQLSTTEGTYDLSPKLLIHAEGGVFSTDDNPSRDYQQTALIANITFAQKQTAWAWERFTAHGPCALLPASTDGLNFNLVWCVERSRAETLLQASDDEFLHQLNTAMTHLTGRLVAVTPLQSFPLGLKKQADLHSNCRIAIGNAAQIIHPVAGQGLNLGLRDAFVLHQQLNTQPSIAQAIGAFSHARRHDRTTTIGITDTLARGFSAFPALKHARSLAFAMINSQPWLKTRIANQFMYGLR